MTADLNPAPPQDGSLTPAVAPRRARRAVHGKVQLKAKPIVLTHDETLDEAMAAIIANACAHWAANDAAARAGRDIEGVHQVRVALRRMRSALSLFKAYIPDTQRDWLNGEARWLLDELGSVRDLDVFAAELLPALTHDTAQPERMPLLTTALRAARRLAQDKARMALESARAQRVLRRLETWLPGHGWRIMAEDDVKDARSVLARDFALRALNKRLIKVLARGKRIDTLPISELHEIRIAVKKIRYGVEFFHTVLPKRRAEKLAVALKELQDSLGHLNDLDVAEQIVGQLTAATKNTTAADGISKSGAAVVAYHRQAADDAVHGIAPRWRNVRKCGLL
jgi:triphosphatase